MVSGGLISCDVVSDRWIENTILLNLTRYLDIGRSALVSLCAAGMSDEEELLCMCLPRFHCSICVGHQTKSHGAAGRNESVMLCVWI